MRVYRLRSIVVGAVALACTPVPAAAQAMAMAGAVSGIVSFGGGGLPPLPALCVPASFSFSGTAQLAMAGSSGSAFAGGVGVTGGGGSGCEDIAHGTGNVTVGVVTYVTIAGGTSVSCTGLTGPYFRFGPHVVLDVLGPCTVNGGATQTVGVVVTGEFLPANAGDGVQRPITSAVFAAVLAGQG